MTEPSRRPSPRTWIALALVLAVVGARSPSSSGSPGSRAHRSRPPATGGDPSRALRARPPDRQHPAAPAPTAPDAPEAGRAVAEPVSVAIPSIGVTSDLMRLGLNDDGTVAGAAARAPTTRPAGTQRGPAPGAVGPAVILGHVDSAEYGPGVFFDLGAVQAGDAVEVARADGTVAEFVVDRVERHPKDEFPTIDVYGNTDDAQLRLITCGGDFDSGVRSYEDNVIVFATLTGTRPA